MASKLILIPWIILLISCVNTPSHPDWEFIQNHGGISIESLDLIDGIYYLPITMSVASFKPGTKHELVCTHSSVRVAGKQLLLRIKTDLKRNQPNLSSACPKAKVGGIPDGHYRVVYVGPKGQKHKVGDVKANLFGD